MTTLPARAVIVHSAAHAAAVRAAAAQARVQVMMISAPHLATAGGPLYTHHLLGAPDEFVTPVMDCGDDPGIAWRAAEAGCKCILFSGPDALLEKVRSAWEKQSENMSCLPLERASGETSGHPDPRFRGDDDSVLVIVAHNLPINILDLSHTTREGNVLTRYVIEQLRQ